MAKDIILSVDESISSTGIAVFSGAELIMVTHIRPDKQKDVLSRMGEIYKILAALVKQYKITVFIAEDVYEARKGKSFLSFRYNLFIQGMLFSLSKQKKNSIYALYNASQWRGILGMNTSDTRENSKQASKDYVKRTLGIDVACDDEADAICLGLAYIKEWTQ